MRILHVIGSPRGERSRSVKVAERLIEGLVAASPGAVVETLNACSVDLPALTGPVMMYALLVHGSGIPPLEDHMLRTRPVRFRAYQSRVNAFWPWPSTTPNEGSNP